MVSVESYAANYHDSMGDSGDIHGHLLEYHHFIHRQEPMSFQENMDTVFLTMVRSTLGDWRSHFMEISSLNMGFNPSMKHHELYDWLTWLWNGNTKNIIRYNGHITNNMILRCLYSSPFHSCWDPVPKISRYHVHVCWFFNSHFYHIWKIKITLRRVIPTMTF